jgi:diketogulonate reductase-like aldo/keto reductase
LSAHDPFSCNIVASPSISVAEKNVTPAQLALAWVLTRGDHIVRIPGTRRSYLEQNVAALQVQLTPDDRAALDHIGVDVAGTRYPAGLHDGAEPLAPDDRSLPPWNQST